MSMISMSFSPHKQSTNSLEKELRNNTQQLDLYIITICNKKKDNTCSTHLVSVYFWWWMWFITEDWPAWLVQYIQKVFQRINSHEASGVAQKRELWVTWSSEPETCSLLSYVCRWIFFFSFLRNHLCKKKKKKNVESLGVLRPFGSFYNQMGDLDALQKIFYPLEHRSFLSLPALRLFCAWTLLISAVNLARGTILEGIIIFFF